MEWLCSYGRECVFAGRVSLCVCARTGEVSAPSLFFLVSQQDFPEQPPRARLHTGCWGCGDVASLGMGVRSSIAKRGRWGEEKDARVCAHTYPHTRTVCKVRALVGGLAWLLL